MPYIPTPEKLKALDFVHRPEHRDGPHWWNKRNGNRIYFVGEDRYWFMQDNPFGTMWFSIPSETFFDELLTAIGWTR